MNKELLTELYSQDPEFVKTYHGLENMSLSDCVEDTWETIENSDMHVFNFGYFTIDKTRDCIPLLTGFFIRPEFRNKETFALFEKEVRAKMPKYFAAVAQKSNEKLNRFFTKMNGQLLNMDTETMNYFLFKQENL